MDFRPSIARDEDEDTSVPPNSDISLCSSFLNDWNSERLYEKYKLVLLGDVGVGKTSIAYW